MTEEADVAAKQKLLSTFNCSGSSTFSIDDLRNQPQPRAAK
jgi:hypothetical protein